MRRRRPLVREPDWLEVCMGVPDAFAINDADGNLIAWDEAAAHEYLAQWCEQDCGDECRAAGHAVPW